MAEERKELTQDEMVKILEENIKKIDDKKFNVYFFVPDTKGNPSGALEYIYQTALTLKKLGYEVTLLHQEKKFVGVEDWLGETFAALPHKNIETENVEIGPSDFLFIPEVFTGVMGQTKDLPCKRVIILQNFNFFVESMNISATLDDLRIRDVVTTSNELARKVNKYFPTAKTYTVQPSIQKIFRAVDEPQELVVNLVCRNQSDVHKIIKPFYWTYPNYKWVSFKDLRGFPQDKFAECLRNGAITVWVDDVTDFGYAALEALRSGTIVIAKTTANRVEWAENENNELTNAIVWFDDFENLPYLIASIVRTWTLDEISDEVYENAKQFNNRFTIEAQETDIKREYVDNLFMGRKKEYTDILAQLKKNKK